MDRGLAPRAITRNGGYYRTKHRGRRCGKCDEYQRNAPIFTSTPALRVSSRYSSWMRGDWSSNSICAPPSFTLVDTPPCFSPSAPPPVRDFRLLSVDG